MSTFFLGLCVCNLVFLCTPLCVFWDPKILFPFSSFLFARVGMWWLKHDHHHPSFFKFGLQMDTSVLCLLSSCVHVLLMSMCVILCFYAHLCIFLGPFCSFLFTRVVVIGVPLFKFFQVQASSEHFRPLFMLFLCPCFACVYVSYVFMCAFHVFFRS